MCRKLTFLSLLLSGPSASNHSPNQGWRKTVPFLRHPLSHLFLEVGMSPSRWPYSNFGNQCNIRWNHLTSIPRLLWVGRFYNIISQHFLNFFLSSGFQKGWPGKEKISWWLFISCLIWFFSPWSALTFTFFSNTSSSSGSSDEISCVCPANLFFQETNCSKVRQPTYKPYLCVFV